MPTALTFAGDYRPFVQDSDQKDVPELKQAPPQEDVVVVRGWDKFTKRCAELEDGDLVPLKRRIAVLDSQLEATRTSYDETIGDLEDAGVSKSTCEDLAKGGDLALSTVKLNQSSARTSRERKLWRQARLDINRMNGTTQLLEDLQGRVDRLRLRLQGPTWPAFNSKTPESFELTTVATRGEVVGTNERGCLLEIELFVDEFQGRPIKAEKVILLVASGLKGCVLGKVTLKRGTVAVTRGPVILRIRGEDRPIPLVHLALLPDVLKRNGRGEVAEVLLKSPPRFDGLR